MLSVRYPAQRCGLRREDIETIKAGVEDILASGHMSYGAWVAEAERKWAGVVGTRHAVMTGAGTQALEMAVRGLHLRGKRVVVPVNTYAASAQAVLHAGAFVHFADVDPEYGMLDPDKLPKAPDAVDAVMVVHIGGNVSPLLGEVLEYCKQRNIPLIEDAAHAHGASSPWGSAGHIGQVGCFSFYPTKNLTCGGEGGALVTDDPEVAEFARMFRHQGRKNPGPGEDPQSYKHVMAVANNYCPDELRALILCTQIDRLREYLANRRAAAKVYAKHFPLVESPESSYYKIITHEAVASTPQVTLPGGVYRTPLHREPAFGYVGMSFPGAEKFCASHRALPVYNDIKPEEVEEICKLLKEGK